VSRDWSFYVEDILDSALKIQRYTTGMTLETFRDNDVVFDAVIRNLEIIGEAAKHLPEEAKALMPEIEWSKAAAFRDVIAHHYFGLNIHIVWDVVLNKIPEIASSADALLKTLRKRDGSPVSGET